ncbi:hypothetical protein GCM10010174_76910 [Kutzneria viridogrisea]|uniref:Iron complex transport system permease protein n=2 Tax=Kutzneria TaxID=43356 RepID=A0ABR6BPJ2_9PSEU|nr:iron chelate uptake ABC transporter family permease subunit [Kutzneria albida]AHH96306.1 putative secreted protein [Kutzneria albida DSM 43870]MBA8928479.1 iron complex transport system permease protein [Kutzneria viridogrisea]
MNARVPVLFGGLAVAVVGVGLLSASLGQYGIPVNEVFGTLWNVRFPRVALSFVVGAVLGVAGAVMQGIFGNPLAEPGVVGVSPAAAVGAAACVLG